MKSLINFERYASPVIILIPGRKSFCFPITALGLNFNPRNIGIVLFVLHPIWIYNPRNYKNVGMLNTGKTCVDKLKVSFKR